MVGKKILMCSCVCYLMRRYFLSNLIPVCLSPPISARILISLVKKIDLAHRPLSKLQGMQNQKPLL